MRKETECAEILSITFNKINSFVTWINISIILPIIVWTVKLGSNVGLKEKYKIIDTIIKIIKFKIPLKNCIFS